MLTPYGKKVRKHRLDAGMKLIDLARKLGVSPAYLSSVETGRKNVTAALAERVGKAMNLSAAEVEELIALARESRSVTPVNLRGASERQRELAVVFARRFSELNEKEIDEVLGLLSKSKARN